MALRVLAIVSFILASMLLLETEADPVISEAQCTLAPRQRTNCGYPGISKEECVSKGCCFDSSIPGVIWCYNVPRPEAADVQIQRAVHPVQEAIQAAQTLEGEEAAAQCTLAPRQRTDCGYPGISKETCVSRGCCFDSSIPGVIWCYYVPRPADADVQVQRAKAVQPVQEAIPAAQTLQGEDDC